MPFGARLRAKATILDLRDVLADVAVTIRYALGDRRRPPTRVRRRIARRGVPTQLRRHHRDVYRLTFLEPGPALDGWSIDSRTLRRGDFDLNAPIGGRRGRRHQHLPHQRTSRALKAGVSPKVISERIGHADVGFFLQTYAHVLKNDDRDAAEQAASFLIGDNWASESDDE